MCIVGRNVCCTVCALLSPGEYPQEPCMTCSVSDAVVSPQSRLYFFRRTAVCPTEKALGFLEFGAKTWKWCAGHLPLCLELLSALIFPGTWVAGSSQGEKRLLGADLIKLLTLAAVCCPWYLYKWLGLSGVLGDPTFSSCTPFFILKVSSLSYRAVSKHVRKTFFCLASGLFFFIVNEIEQNISLSMPGFIILEDDQKQI